MYLLNDRQVDFILNDIRARGVDMEDLQYNLLDHICCIIEQNLEPDGNFEDFYQKTIPKFYKHGLWEVEEETILLLTFKHYYAMKKIMFASGLTASLLMIAGITFKFMHWPGASVMLVLSIPVISLVFLPLFFILKAREKQDTRDKVMMGVGAIPAIFIAMGILFKVMHWPGANLLGGIAIAIMAVFIPVYFFTGIRKPEKKADTIVSTVLMVVGTGLFLTLLNTRPSNSIEHTSMLADEDLLNTYEQVSRQNNVIHELMLKDSAAGKLADLTERCRSLCVQIDSLKLNIARRTEGEPLKTLHFTSLYNSGNYDTPTAILFTFAEPAPSPLMLDIKKQVRQLNSMVESRFKQKIALIDLDDKPGDRTDGIASWEINHFYHTPLSVVLRNFTQLQLEIRRIEAGCYSLAKA